MSHDQLFKDLLQAFFHDFLPLFLPKVASAIDADSITFRGAEYFTDVPEGELRRADLVAELRTLDGEPDYVLLHTEVQGRLEPDFAYRMWEYNALIRLRTKRPVISVALVLSPGTRGVSLESFTETLFETEHISLTYWQVGLRDLDADDWMGAGQPLVAALCALMRPGDRGRGLLKLALLRRIRDSGLDDARVFLLLNAVETYLGLDEDEEHALRVGIGPESEVIMEATEMTWADRILMQGQEQGLEQGLAAGEISAKRQIIMRQARARFTALPDGFEHRVAQADSAMLDNLIDRIVQSLSLEEFLRGL